MPRQSRATSPAVARLLRGRRQQLGLSLREVERRTSSAGSPIPFSTLAKIEQGRVDPGVKRLHRLMELYHLPMQAAGDLLDLEMLADARPELRDPEALYQEGVEHMRRGDTRKGLAYLITLREQVPDEEEGRALHQKARLSFAIAAGSLGKYRLSLQIVEDLLVESLDPSLVVPVLVQAGSVWNGLGSPEAALSFFERAETHLGASSHRERAWVAHGKAVALKNQGRHEQAGAALDEAARSYRKADDAYGEARSVGARVKLFLSVGDLSGALSAARGGKEHAERHGFARIRLLRLLDEGQALVAMENAESGLAALNEALGAAIAAGDQAAQFFAHYHLWKAHSSLGHRDRADVELGAARYYVRFVDDATEETEEIRRILRGKVEKGG